MSAAANRHTVRRATVAAVAAVILGAIADVGAQSGTRRLTTVESVRQFPGYFHLQQVLLRGEFVEQGNTLVLRSDEQDLPLLNPSEARGGAVEVRGQIFDIGRLEPDDPRIGSYAERRGTAPWPRPGTELVLDIGNVADAPPAVTPSVRAVALEPWKFGGQKVTVTGTFRGRNLFGDLPAAPGTSRFDFVLTGAEGAVWVTGMRPRGRGFDLDVDRRMDTSRVLEVTGIVGVDRGHVVIAASEIALGKDLPAPAAPPESSEAPVAAPVEVVFSSPTPDEEGVPTDTEVRVQFSRGLRESSIAGQVRVSYLGGPPADPTLQVQTSYDGATRALHIRFTKPLEPFRTIRIQLLPGLTAFDGGAFEPWTLTFSVGGR